MSSVDLMLEYCAKSYPARPIIESNETPWKRDELDARVDYWMDLLARATRETHG